MQLRLDVGRRRAVARRHNTAGEPVGSAISVHPPTGKAPIEVAPVAMTLRMNGSGQTPPASAPL
jgi:hypothetical protein